MDCSGPHRYRPAASLYAYRQSWFSRYLSTPVRELLDAGPFAEQALRAPRHANACILFTDMRGFTEFSRSIAPGVLMATMDRCIGRQAAAVARHGGYVDNFTGDGLMAVFEGDDREQNGCRCALEIVRQPGRDGTDNADGLDVVDEQVPIGAGLHTGEVVMGTVGCESHLTYATVGETVNAAARLSDRAKGRNVLITGAVRGALSDALARRFSRLDGPSPGGVDPAMTLYGSGRH